MLTTERPSSTARARSGARPPQPSAGPGRPVHRRASAKGGSYWVLVLLLIVLSLTGVVMVLSASSIVSLTHYGSPWHFFIRQWVWLIIGAAGFYFAVRYDHERWRRPARLFML
jgi:cell division protein FtsW (lipid II flippase)